MTTETGEPGHTPPIASPPRKNSFERLAGVLFAPADTFEDIARKPDYLVPILVILILGYLTTILIMPRFDWDAMAAAQGDAIKKQNPNMTEADLERAGKMAKAFGTVIGYVSPLLGFAWLAIVAGVLLLAFRLLGGEGGYGQAFSTVLYAWMPMVISGIVITIVVLARGTVDPMSMATLVKSNPAFLVDQKEQAILFALLSSFDIFTIWMLILLIIGFATFARTSKGKAAGIIISLWLVLILIKAGFAYLGQMRMNA